MVLRNPNPELLPIAHDDEFLPPVSGWTIFGGFFLVGTVVAAFTVSAFTPLPVTVKAPGVVRPTGEVKLVQAPTEGTVTEINIRENQTVTEGETLVVLDTSRVSTRQSQLEISIDQVEQQLEQVSGQLANLNLQLNAETERMNRAIAVAEADHLRMQTEHGERRLTVEAQVDEARANLLMAEEEWQKIQSDIQAYEASLRASESALKIAQEKLNRYQPLAESGALSRNQLEEAQLAVEQQQEAVAERTALLAGQKQTALRQTKAIESAEARLQAALAAANPSDGMVTMAAEKIAQEKATGAGTLARLNQERSSLFQRQSELEKQLESDRQELLQVEHELRQTVVSAPISGTILKLNLRNSNQIVRVGEEIAQITPNDTPLVIKARVATQDIGKVKVDQKAQMRVSAYPYPDYGILSGTVETISPDAIILQNSGSNPIPPYYEVTIEPKQFYLKDDPKNALLSGMEIQADIIAQDETVLKFILRKARLLTDL
jgi:multidrug efflux pump subunit AcrA (membrane-fusion protein)